MYLTFNQLNSFLISFPQCIPVANFLPNVHFQTRYWKEHRHCLSLSLQDITFLFTTCATQKLSLKLLLVTFSKVSKSNQSLEILTGIWVLTFRMVTKGHVGWKVACG